MEWDNNDSVEYDEIAAFEQDGSTMKLKVLESDDKLKGYVCQARTVR